MPRHAKTSYAGILGGIGNPPVLKLTPVGLRGGRGGGSSAAIIMCIAIASLEGYSALFLWPVAVATYYIPSTVNPPPK